jgi:hypothetical protein
LIARRGIDAELSFQVVENMPEILGETIETSEVVIALVAEYVILRLTTGWEALLAAPAVGAIRAGANLHGGHVLLR